MAWKIEEEEEEVVGAAGDAAVATPPATLERAAARFSMVPDNNKFDLFMYTGRDDGEAEFLSIQPCSFFRFFR